MSNQSISFQLQHVFTNRSLWKSVCAIILFSSFTAQAVMAQTSPLVVPTGTGFRQGSVARWENKKLSTNFIGPTQLKARVPFHFLSINVLKAVKPNTPGGSGPRGISSAGAKGTARLRVRNPGGRMSNRIVFTVTYEVVGG